MTTEAAASSVQGTDGSSAAGPAPAPQADAAEAPMDADSSGSLASLSGYMASSGDPVALSRGKLELQRAVSQKPRESPKKLRVEIVEHEAKAMAGTLCAASAAPEHDSSSGVNSPLTKISNLSIDHSVAHAYA